MSCLVPVILTVGLLYSLFTAGLFGVVAFLADRHYRQLPILPRPAATSLSSIAVIIPARNEAANIGRAAASLVKLRYPTFSVTVVDDHSQDDTALQARSAGAAVLQLESEPPPGWTGKCNACDQGARRASADWLLFTDADTFHQPDSLAAAVAYAETHALDALSLLLHQECVGLWDRAILPLAYQQYFAGFRSEKPIFNGQYILIRRAVYERSGGFGAVRGRVMEDVALAELLTQHGYRTALLNGEQAAGVRMYATFGALWRGMTKTAFSAARDRGPAGWLLGAVTFAGLLILLQVLFGLWTASPGLILAGAAVWLINGLLLIPWLRRFGVKPIFGYILFNIPALSLLWLIGLVSTFQTLLGAGVHWKGRTIVESRRAG